MLDKILLGLQAFQALFLFTYDWVPLGRLNDVTAFADRIRCDVLR